MKQKLVFIASLSHSGSTLINLLLGNHPQLVGLGEVDTVLQMNSAELESEKVMRCSCGHRVANCQFWTRAITALQSRPSANLVDRYRILFATFQRLYTPDFQIVDSSKYLEQLRTVISLPNTDLKVIHLIKDVRGFAVSQRDATNAELKYHHLPVLFGSVPLSRWLYLHTLKTATYLFWKWYLRNVAIQRLLKRNRIAHICVGYDQLAQDPRRILSRIYEFLGLETPRKMSLVPKLTNSHAFMGNPMLGDSTKMSSIIYDDRWEKRSDWRLAALLFPHILAFNAGTVYSNSLSN
ncbi:MAG: sulfotransferase [Anaerolineales bacterium]